MIKIHVRDGSGFEPSHYNGPDRRERWTVEHDLAAAKSKAELLASQCSGTRYDWVRVTVDDEVVVEHLKAKVRS